MLYAVLAQTKIVLAKWLRNGVGAGSPRYPGLSEGDINCASQAALPAWRALLCRARNIYGFFTQDDEGLAPYLASCSMTRTGVAWRANQTQSAAYSSATFASHARASCHGVIASGNMRIGHCGAQPSDPSYISWHVFAQFILDLDEE